MLHSGATRLSAGNLVDSPTLSSAKPLVPIRNFKPFRRERLDKNVLSAECFFVCEWALEILCFFVVFNAKLHQTEGFPVEFVVDFNPAPPIKTLWLSGKLSAFQSVQPEPGVFPFVLFTNRTQ